jgi:hypothetical protein
MVLRAPRSKRNSANSLLPPDGNRTMSVAPTDAAHANRQRLQTLVLLAAATFVCLVPFLNKAYCIDDSLFLWTAQHIQHQPLDFYGFDVNWYGVTEPMHDVTKNPPLAGYYLALAASLVGWSEPALHGAFLLPALGTVWGTWYLAGLLCRQPAGAALATIVSPVFLVSSTNVMCDTMMLCLWVWAIALWVKGLDGGHPGWLAAAALLIAAAALTKYFAVSLIPLLAVYTVMKSPRSSWKLIVLLIPVAVLAGYQWWTSRHYGRGLLLDAADYASTERARSTSAAWLRTLDGLCFTGACGLVAGFCAPWLLSLRGMLATGVTALAIAALVFAGISEDTLYAFKILPEFKIELSLQIGLLAALGLLVLWLTVADGWRRRDADAALLGLWVFGTFVFAAYVNWTCNGRSVLPIVPALGLLMARHFDDQPRRPKTPADRWMWGLLPAAALGLLVAWADYRLANSARSAAQRVMDIANSRGTTAWFQGHWGFQYYMQRHGAKPVDFRNYWFKTGELLVKPSKNTHLIDHTRQEVRMLKVIEEPVCSWLSTLERQIAAGFYASTHGPMPFVFGPTPPETYAVWLVLEDPPEE